MGGSCVGFIGKWEYEIPYHFGFSNTLEKAIALKKA